MTPSEAVATRRTHARTIPFGRPWITEDERRAVLDVLDGPILTHGPQGKAFESEFSAFLGDAAHAVSVSSCMAALHLAYVHFGLGPGDEVIVPALTHTATAHAVELVGARPVFVDCDPESGNLRADRIERAITPHTKAISVVHFLGIPCEMPPIMQVAERHGLKVIEDCALAVGTRYDGRHVGLFGDVGCFSFYPVKHITTGEGGMFVTRHGSAAEQVARLRGFGVDRAHQDRAIPGMYDVPQLGLNYRMSELHAALGRAQMRRIDENLSRRRANFETIKKALGSQEGIQIIDTKDPRAENSHYCISLVLDEGSREKRNALVESLIESGIGTSVYYPHPVPRLRYYADKYGYDPEQFPAASTISDASVALPVGPHLDDSDVEYIAETVVATLKELRS